MHISTAQQPHLAPATTPVVTPAPSGGSATGTFAQALGRASQSETVESTTTAAEATTGAEATLLAARRGAVRDVMSHLPPPYMRQLAAGSAGDPSPSAQFDILFEVIDSGEMTLTAEQAQGRNVFAHMRAATEVFDSPTQMWDEMRQMLGAPQEIRAAVQAAHTAGTTSSTSASTAAANTAATEAAASTEPASTATAEAAHVYDVIGGAPSGQQLQWWDHIIAMLSQTVSRWEPPTPAA